MNPGNPWYGPWQPLDMNWPWQPLNINPANPSIWTDVGNPLIWTLATPWYAPTLATPWYECTLATLCVNKPWQPLDMNWPCQPLDTSWSRQPLDKNSYFTPPPPCYSLHSVTWKQRGEDPFMHAADTPAPGNLRAWQWKNTCTGDQSLTYHCCPRSARCPPPLLPSLLHQTCDHHLLEWHRKCIRLSSLLLTSWMKTAWLVLKTGLWELFEFCFYTLSTKTVPNHRSPMNSSNCNGKKKVTQFWTTFLISFDKNQHLKVIDT